MADGRGRSDEEREAARRERELRRARQMGQQPTPPPATPRQPPPAAPSARPAPEQPVAPPPAVATQEEDETVGEFVTDEHDVPAGTRRVSALERIGNGQRQRRVRPVKPSLPMKARRHSLRNRIGSVIGLILGIALIWFLIELFQPFHGSPHGHLVVQIPPNTSASGVGDILARDGVISSSFFFGLRTRLEGDRGDLRSGTYHLQLGMSYGSVLKILTTPPKAAPTSELTLIPGKTRKQIDVLLHEQHIRGDYLVETRHSRGLNPAAYGAPRSTPDLEGFLFPNTYQLRDPITVAALVADQLQEFKKQFATENFNYAGRKGLTPYDVLIIASMVETEAATEHDRLAVASVIYNRLAKGMPLQIDATTRYATGNYSSPLTISQLNSSSPYNTRNHTGLPPTPIDSPSLLSIEAAAHPLKSNYLYFVVTPCGNGSMTFTGNYAAFLHDQAVYQQARAAHGGRSPAVCK